jgi:hypothetical protein
LDAVRVKADLMARATSIARVVAAVPRAVLVMNLSGAARAEMARVVTTRLKADLLMARRAIARDAVHRMGAVLVRVVRGCCLRGLASAWT